MKRALSARVQTMRENKERPRSGALVAALSTLLVLGAACHLDSLFNPRRAGPRQASGQPGPESLVQLRSDSATMIPTGGSVPEPSIVVRAVVRDADHSDTLTLRLQVEVRPVGTGLQGDPTGESNPTTSGDSAYVRVSGLADNTGYHWQARVVDQTGRASAWWSYGDNSENAADVQVGVPPNHLAFTRQPTTTTAGVIIVPPVEVTVMDPRGNTDRSFSGSIDVALYTNPSGGNLSGTTTAPAVNGVATFPGLSIDQAGNGYRLQATGPGVTSATSALFNITPPPGGGAPIALWGFNGTLPPQSGTTLGKEFNPQNPPLGSTVIATFVWRGSTNIITSVTDELWTGRQVGNTYTLVEYVTAGGISMATYVATNVQNYPSPKGVLGEELLVRAHLSTAVSAGGALVSAFTGVNPVSAQALGAHRSATGSGSTITTAHPGAITVNAGALAYAVSMVTDGLIGFDRPPGFTYITTLSSGSAAMQFDVDYAVPTSTSSLDPQWRWTFNSPNTWLASILALNPAPGP
jgi:hypothetical protein